MRKLKGRLNFVLYVLGCFFGLGLELFAGCVKIHHNSSRIVNFRQKKLKKVKKSQGAVVVVWQSHSFKNL
ncbi:MAG: hypothetical protein ABSD42_11505, partial [Candidatus Bathyarchaeia archaeon]